MLSRKENQQMGQEWSHHLQLPTLLPFHRLGEVKYSVQVLRNSLVSKHTEASWDLILCGYTGLCRKLRDGPSVQDVLVGIFCQLSSLFCSRSCLQSRSVSSRARRGKYHVGISQVLSLGRSLLRQSARKRAENIKDPSVLALRGGRFTGRLALIVYI